MRRLTRDFGQTTVEYALVLLAAAAVAILLITWARDNQAITGFFSNIIAKITNGAPSP
ncbi:MAG: DUF4244 domain-containing protein [Actinomycetota bacterium]